jgi:hypothetical protein
VIIPATYRTVQLKAPFKGIKDRTAAWVDVFLRRKQSFLSQLSGLEVKANYEIEPKTGGRVNNAI